MNFLQRKFKSSYNSIYGLVQLAFEHCAFVIAWSQQKSVTSLSPRLQNKEQPRENDKSDLKLALAALLHFLHICLQLALDETGIEIILLKIEFDRGKG